MLSVFHQEQPVMDLNRFTQWIINTPALLAENHPIVGCSPFDADSSLEPHGYQGNPRLGFIYQHLFSRLFSASEKLNITAEEIQINDNGKTLGAIDFIVETQSHQHQHWEVAIKFYLLYKAQWYGPNANDRLDKKLDHMLTHQLNMSSHPLFVSQYPKWQPITKRLLLQGRLYINPFLNHPIPEYCLGYQITKSQISGYWCFHSQLKQVKETLYPLEKHQWATGCLDKKSRYQGAADGFAHCQDNNGHFWFIVPDSWPNN
jgi:uncharacterized protein